MNVFTARGRIVIGLLVILILPLLMLTAFEYINMNLLRRESIRAGVLREVNPARVAFDTHITELKRRAGELARSRPTLAYVEYLQPGKNSGVRPGRTAEKLERLLGQFQNEAGGKIHHVMLVDLEGRVLISPVSRIAGNPRNQTSGTAIKQPDFRHHRGGRIPENALTGIATTSPVITPPLLFSDGKHRHQLLLQPVLDAEGERRAILVFELEMSFYKELLGIGLPESGTTMLSLVSREGQPLSRDPAADTVVADPALVARALRNGIADREYMDGDKRILELYIKDGENPWVFLVDHTVSGEQSGTGHGFRRTIIFASAIGLLFFLPGIFLGNRFLQPGRALQEKLTAVLNGHAPVSVLQEVRGESPELSSLAGQLAELMTRTAEKTAEGGRVVAGLNVTAADLRVKVHEYSEYSVVMSTAFQESSATIEEMSSSVNQVANLIKDHSKGMDKTAQDVNELNTTIDNINDTMQDLTELARMATANAHKGEEKIREVIGAMEAIKNNSSRIGEIVLIINDISDRTNLLSLNAAIEAARAGEGGRGFAVVADEISKLADKTGQSVKEIETLIDVTVEAVNIGVVQVDNAAKSLKDAINSIGYVDSAVIHVTEAIHEQTDQVSSIKENSGNLARIENEISAAIQEQKSGIDEFNMVMVDLANRSADYMGFADRMKELVEDIEKNLVQLKEIAENQGRV